MNDPENQHHQDPEHHHDRGHHDPHHQIEPEHDNEREDFSKSYMLPDARKKRVDSLGEKYQIPEFWGDKLPVKIRKCTDICCLIIFVIVVVLMFITTIIILTSTNPTDLYKLYDSSGNDCGVGDAKDYPLLYMQTFKSPYKSVCVKSCPSYDYNQMKYNATGALSRPVHEGEDSDYSRAYIKASSTLGFEVFDQSFAGKSSTHSIKMDNAEIFGFDSGFANSFYTAAGWESYLSRMHVDCFPNQEFANCEYKKNTFWVYDSYPVLGLMCAPLHPKPALFFYKISSKINHGMIGDLLDSKWLFLYTGLIAILVSIVFLALTQFCGKFIVWIIGIATALLFILLGIGVFVTYHHDGPLHDKANHLKIKYLSFLLAHKILFHFLAVVFILIGIYIIYVLISKRKDINLALPLLEIAAKSSLRNFLLIFVGFMVIVLQALFILVELYVILRLFTMGKEQNDREHGSPFVDYDLGFVSIMLLILHVFGSYWVLVWLNNFNDFINSAVTVNYYFGTKLNNLNIFCHSLGHNAGSVAWTIVILPTLIIKTVFWPFKWCFTTEHPNKLQKKVNSSCNGCCVCYEYLFDSICENYMAITYMGSENFLIATRRYFFLTQKYLAEHQTVSFLGFLYSILARCGIAILSGYFGILIYRSNQELQQNVKYVGIVFMILFVISFFIASLFINLLSTAYDTVLICYLAEFNLFEQSKSQYTLQAREDIKDALKGTINREAMSYIRLLDR